MSQKCQDFIDNLITTLYSQKWFINFKIITSSDYYPKYYGEDFYCHQIIIPNIIEKTLLLPSDY